MERTFQIIVDGKVHEYIVWEEALEDFQLYLEDEYTTIELYDCTLRAVLIEAELGIVTDRLGLLE